MKVLTVLGTRPEIIRLSLVIEKLDRACTHVLVHTGQNYAESLNEVFFRELGVRNPDYNLGVRAPTFGEQVGRILIEVEQVLLRERPDRVVVLGDTNSGLSAVVATRLGIPVFHLEAGNRCYDDRVPEEVNRRIIDHSSAVLMPYTHRAAANLVREGIERSRIHVIGNPIFEIIEHNRPSIEASGALGAMGLTPGGFFLVTMHRAENVDLPERLQSLVQALRHLADTYRQPVVCSLHPRTRSKLEAFGIVVGQADVRFVEPMGFFDFLALERQARCVLTDSGTVQEECCILRVPNVTVRDVTERPETIEAGSNMLTGMDPERIAAAVRIVLEGPSDWNPPTEYLEGNVADKVVRIVLGYEWRVE